MPQYPHQPPCPHISDDVVMKIEVCKACALPKYPHQPPCPVVSDAVLTKIEVSKACALFGLLQLKRAE